MNKRECREITVQEIFYLLSFSILFGARAVGLYEGKLLYNIALVFGLLIWGIKILMTEHSILEYLMIGFLTLLTLIVYKNTGEKGILLYFTMMLGMKGVCVKNVFKIGCGILSLSYIVLVLSSILGINNEIMYIQYRSGWGEVFRHSLGYPHPNTLHNTYVILVVMIMYLVGKQKWKNLLVVSAMFFLGSCYIYLYSGSRTGLLTTVIYLFINYWFQTRKNISVIEKVLICMLYPGCLFISIIGPLVIKGKLFDIIDKILSTRWSLSVYYLQNEPITLLGTRYKETPSPHYMIDSSFLYSFLQLGLVTFFIITILYICIIYKYVKLEARTELAIIISFCIMGISDPFMFNLSYKNLIFVFIGKIIYESIGNLENKLPDIMRYKIQVLEVGNKIVSYSKVKFDNTIWKKKDWLRGSLIVILAVVSSLSIYIHNTVSPTAMYVSKSIWDDNVRRGFPQTLDGQGEEFYLTQEEVHKLKSEGTIIIRYESESVPMCKITGDAPKMEYNRNLASIGVWSGIASFVIWILIKYGVSQKLCYEKRE